MYTIKHSDLEYSASAVVEITKIMKTSIKVLVINGGNVETNKGVAVNKKLELEWLSGFVVKYLEKFQKRLVCHDFSRKFLKFER